MNIIKWKPLTPEKQQELAEGLKVSPYTDSELFEAIAADFKHQFSGQPMVGNVRCSFGPGLGPYNCISVDTLRNGPEQIA